MTQSNITWSSFALASISIEGQEHSLEELLANMHLFFKGDIPLYSCFDLPILPLSTMLSSHSIKGYTTFILENMNDQNKRVIEAINRFFF